MIEKIGNLLARWQKASQILAQMKEEEMSLRKEIFSLAFPHAKEGTNTMPLENGWKLVAVHKINRTLDVAAFDNARQSMADIGIDPRELIKYSPELVTGEYNKLSEDQKQLVDFCLTSKPGAPSLTLKPPASAK